MKPMTSLTAKGFRRTVLAFFALSSILPLLIYLYVLYDHIYPALNAAQLEKLMNVITLGLGAMLLVPILGAILMFWWIRSLETLAKDVRHRTMEVVPHEDEEQVPENEMLLLRQHFDLLHTELQDKIGQINAYSQKLIESNIKLTEMATMDALTGLYNRRHFQERLDEEAGRAERDGHDLSLIMIDVDGFKQYNDDHGHPAGDRLLRNLGRLIKTSIRKTDLAFRYGGDEFAVLLPRCSVKDARGIAQKMVRSISSPAFIRLMEGESQHYFH